MQAGSRTSLCAGARSMLSHAVVTPNVVRASRSGGPDVRDPLSKILIDEFELLSYYHLNTGKEVIDNI